MTHFKHYVYLGVLLLLCTFTPAKVHAVVPSLLFEPASISAQVGEDFTASIFVETAGQNISGAGAKIIYDPTYLTAKSIDPTDLFVDYPATIIDPDNRRLTISGIASSPTDQFSGKAAFADVTFTPLKTGTSQLTFVFTPGSTTDSNLAVMSDVGDILTEVNTLTVTIGNDSGDTGNNDDTLDQTDDTTDNTLTESLNTLKSSTKKVFKKISQTLGISNNTRDVVTEADQSKIASTTDPLAPIVRQPPITDPTTTQPSSSPNRVIYVLIIIILLLILIIAAIFYYFNRRSHNESVPVFPTDLPPTSVPPTTIN